MRYATHIPNKSHQFLIRNFSKLSFSVTAIDNIPRFVTSRAHGNKLITNYAVDTDWNSDKRHAKKPNDILLNQSSRTVNNEETTFR